MNPTRCTCGCMPTLINMSSSTFVYNCFACGTGAFPSKTRDEAVIQWNTIVSRKKLQMQIEEDRKKLDKWSNNVR